MRVYGDIGKLDESVKIKKTLGANDSFLMFFVWHDYSEEGQHLAIYPFQLFPK